MSKITAKLLAMKPAGDKDVLLSVDCDQIWGQDEVLELKAPIRAVAALFDLDNEDVEKSGDAPGGEYAFSQTRELVANWETEKLKHKDILLTLE